MFVAGRSSFHKVECCFHIPSYQSVALFLSLKQRRLLADWTSDSFDEDCYIDIRAYGKSERTREFVLDGMTQIQGAFAEHDLVANVRLETYNGERYFHVPPKK